MPQVNYVSLSQLDKKFLELRDKIIDKGFTFEQDSALLYVTWTNSFYKAAINHQHNSFWSLDAPEELAQYGLTIATFSERDMLNVIATKTIDEIIQALFREWDMRADLSSVSDYAFVTAVYRQLNLVIPAGYTRGVVEDPAVVEYGMRMR